MTKYFATVWLTCFQCGTRMLGLAKEARKRGVLCQNCERAREDRKAQPASSGATDEEGSER